MSNKVTNRQLFFILFLTLTTYTTIDLPKVMAQTTGRSSWIPIVIASLFFGCVALVISKLNNMFPNKVFFDYSQMIIGKSFAYFIGIYYMLYFIVIGVYLKIKMAGVVTSNFMPKSPHFVFLVFGITLFGYIAYKGITNIARLFEIYGVTFLLVTISICVLMSLEGDKYNILPLFSSTDFKQIPNSLKSLILPYGGIEILFVIPFTLQNKKAPRTALFTILFIGLLYVTIVGSTIFVLGINNTIVLNDSFIEAIKITSAPVIERLDMFYLIFGLSSLFCGMIMVFSATVEYACKIFSKVKRHIIVITIAIVLLLLTLWLLNMKNASTVLETYLLLPVLFSSTIIPVCIYILAKVKKVENVLGGCNEKN
jgi:spore germination protein